MVCKLKVFSFSLVLFLSCTWSFASEPAKKYAVETIGGVPVMTIDGQPVRARMFWGRADNGASFAIEPKKKTIEFVFSPSQDAMKKGTIHFRFGKEAGLITIDDFSIEDVSTGKIVAGPYTFESESDYTGHWKVWNDVVQKETVAQIGVKQNKNDSSRALAIEIFPPKQGLKSDFHLYHFPNLDLKKKRSYRIRFSIQSSKPRTINLDIYRPANPYVKLGQTISPDMPLVRQTKLAADAGVHFVSFLYRDCWKTEDGTWDWSTLDAICDAILAANPKALLIPRPGMNAPKWWLDKNPDERMVWKDTRPFKLNFGKDWASPASLKYRAAACEALAAMIEHLEKKYGSSIAGYHPYGQNTGEWFTVNSWSAGLSGFGVADKKGWRKWLRDTYRTDAELQKAWRDPAVTLANAVVPSAELRRASMTSPLLDPTSDPRHQALIDFNVWTQKEMTDTILALAKTIRQKTNGNKLSLTFYGYSFELSVIEKGPAATAHYNIRALLDSPDIDMICSPMSYFDRQPGGGGSCMLTAESVSTAGKMYLYEDDTRTFLTTETSFPGHESGATILSGTQNLLLRNTAECAVRNFGSWWMDLGGSGWFDDVRLWDSMRHLKTIDDYFLKNPTPYCPQVGLFLDEYSMLKITSGRYSREMVSRCRRPFNRLGTPYGQYLLSDLLEGKIKPPKLCVVLNPKALSDEQMKKVKEVTKNVSLHFIDFDGITEEALRQAALKANVFFYTKEPCNVWASSPYAVLHGSQDGDVHFVAPQGESVYDGITGKRLFNGRQGIITLQKGETRILYFPSQQ